MLNIEVQTCGLVLDLLLIYFSLRHERVGLQSEELFQTSLSINLSCIILDIFSIYMIVYAERFPLLLVDIVCKLYLVSLMAASYMGFVYAYSDVRKLRENRLFRHSQMVIALLGGVIILALPIHYVSEGREIYSYGPADVATYIFAPLFILSALVTTFVYGKQMNPHRRRAVRAWMIIEIVAAGIQFVKPTLLLVGFGSAVGMFILYAELENPEAHLDSTTGVFSFHCLSAYLRQLYEHEKRFACIFVETGNEWHVEDAEEERQILLDMSLHFHALPGAKLFRAIGNDFVLLYEPAEGYDYEQRCAEDLQLIRQRFDEPWDEVEIPASYLHMTDSRIAVGADELVSIYQYYRSEVEAERRETVKLDYQATSDIRDYREMRREIREAIREDRVEVYYQPIYSVAKQSFVSAEALARLRSRDGGILMPGRFIPVAESSGLIEMIGERVFDKTCRMLKESDVRERGIRYVEVNLSVAQCEDSALAEKYKRILEHHGLEANTINLEITETSALNQRGVLLGNMARLKDFGCSFSLDDFGNGESNLNYVVDMPVDIVKFDRSMVQDYFTTERARIVMDSTVAMIKRLGLKIVAEGVETAEQYEAMARIGVDYIQGFYFSKPLPEAEFIAFIREKNALTQSRPAEG